MKILIACEFSGTVREAFARRGHDVMSCDLLPTERECCELTSHYQGDVRELLDDNWDMMLAFPPCTYLCSSGLHWNNRRAERAQETETALNFVRLLLDAPIKKVVLENPIGCIGTRIRKADQIIQPNDFGHDANKATCLWLKNVPKLIPTKKIEPRVTSNGKKRWANQTDSGQNRLTPSPRRWAERSATYSGVADAFAEQWG